MATKSGAQPGHQSEIAELLTNRLADLPGLRVGKTFGHPAFSVGSKVFAFVYRRGVVLKLPRETIDGLLDRKGYAPFKMGGRVMKEWMEVRRDDPSAYEVDIDLFRQAAAFVSYPEGQRSRCPKKTTTKTRTRKG